MKEYVIVLAVGPVQGFISAARRSRDLWSGSWLLSELAKACAFSLAKNQAELIFPSVKNISELEPFTDFSAGNKIQAIVHAQSLEDLKAIIEQAKEATKTRFIAEANAAKNELKSAEKDLRSEIWCSQINDYVEVQAAWAEISKKDQHGYKNAVELASKVLAARKATRNFSPSVADPYLASHMIPKSSLDGMRETVLKENTQLKDYTRIQLSLSDSEQLDCAGIVKRLGLKSKAEQFTPYIRVAAQAWVKEVSSAVEFEQVKACYESLISSEIATRVKGNEGIYAEFAYDGQYLYQYRLEAALQQYQFDCEIVTKLSELKNALQPLWKKYGRPYSYGVMLLADGDRMGELLDHATTKEQHQAITEALSAFAGAVPKHMRDFQGHCIYSGGDDVLGFVPLHEAYNCAESLRQSFYQALLPISEKLGVDIPPTLSVGLAICHVNTPLSVIRELASKAEKFAKGDHCSDLKVRRNALGLLLSVRSGTDTLLRLRWDDSQAHQQFESWIKFYADKHIPTRIAYDTRAIDLSTKYIAQDNPLLQKKIRHAEYTRMLKKTRLVTGEKISEDVMNQLKNRGDQVGYQQLAEELIVARWFAEKLQQDLGKE